MKLQCECGHIIPDDNIKYYEYDTYESHYSECECYCDVCKTEFNVSIWGTFDDIEHVKENLEDHHENLHRVKL